MPRPKGTINFPEDKKCLILNRMRLLNLDLWNTKALDNPKTVKAWEQLLAYAQSLDCPEIQCVKDLRKIFAKWKTNFRQKIVKRNDSGAGGKNICRQLKQSDTTIDNIIRENPYHEKREVGSLIIFLHAIHKYLGLCNPVLTVLMY